ncbi:hypothetical protein [Halovivax gelatinilyticus]|uniref:hypothetical protein n=1 Tax=Halovivax gelatinilyticus TaxID=2961597 RepID=UPI0020CA7046|nr:hypothetical protein [Halovivax gelatinilyticus]
MTGGYTIAVDQRANRLANSYRLAVDSLAGNVCGVSLNEPDERFRGQPLESKILFWQIVSSLVGEYEDGQAGEDSAAGKTVGIEQEAYTEEYFNTLCQLGIFNQHGTLVRPDQILFLLGFGEYDAWQEKLMGESKTEQVTTYTSLPHMVLPEMIEGAKQNVENPTHFHKHGQEIVAYRRGMENSALKLVLLLLHGETEYSHRSISELHADKSAIIDASPGELGRPGNAYTEWLAELPYLKQLDALRTHIELLSQSKIGQLAFYYLFENRDHEHCIDPKNVFDPPVYSTQEIESMESPPIVYVCPDGKDSGFSDYFDSEGRLIAAGSVDDHFGSDGQLADYEGARIADVLQRALMQIGSEFQCGLQLYADHDAIDVDDRRSALIEYVTAVLGLQMTPGELTDAIDDLDGKSDDKWDLDEWDIEDVATVTGEYAKLFQQTTTVAELSTIAAQNEWENPAFPSMVEAHRQTAATVGALVQFTTLFAHATSEVSSAFEPGEAEYPEPEDIRDAFTTFVGTAKSLSDFADATSSPGVRSVVVVRGLSVTANAISALTVVSNVSATIEHYSEGDTLKAFSTGLQSGLGAMSLLNERRVARMLGSRLPARLIPGIGWGVLALDVVSIATEIAANVLDEDEVLRHLEHSVYGPAYESTASDGVNGTFADPADPLFGFARRTTDVQVDDGRSDLNRQISAFTSLTRPLGDETAQAMLRPVSGSSTNEYQLYIELVQEIDRIKTGGTLYVRPIVHYEDNANKPNYLCPALHRLKLGEFHEHRPNLNDRQAGERTTDRWQSQFPYRPEFPFTSDQSSLRWKSEFSSRPEFPNVYENGDQLGNDDVDGRSQLDVEQRWLSGPEQNWWYNSIHDLKEQLVEQTDDEYVTPKVNEFYAAVEDPLLYHLFRFDWTDLDERDVPESGPEFLVPNYGQYVTEEVETYPQNHAHYQIQDGTGDNEHPSNVYRALTEMETGIDAVRLYPNNDDRFAGVSVNQGTDEDARETLRGSYSLEKLLICLRGHRVAVAGEYASDDYSELYLELSYVPPGGDELVADDVVYGIDIGDLPNASRKIVPVELQDAAGRNAGPGGWTDENLKLSYGVEFDEVWE